MEIGYMAYRRSAIIKYTVYSQFSNVVRSTYHSRHQTPVYKIKSGVAESSCTFVVQLVCEDENLHIHILVCQLPVLSLF